MRHFLRCLVIVVAASRPAVWLHVHWHGGRPCPRAVRQLADERWMRAAVRAATGTPPSAPPPPVP